MTDLFSLLLGDNDLDFDAANSIIGDPNALLSNIKAFFESGWLSEKSLCKALVIMRNVLPRNIPLSTSESTNPLERFDFIILEKTLSMLFKLFENNNYDISYHSAVTFAKFAAFKEMFEADSVVCTLCKAINGISTSTKTYSRCVMVINLVLEDISVCKDTEQCIFDTIYPFFQDELLPKGVFVDILGILSSISKSFINNMNNESLKSFIMYLEQKSDDNSLIRPVFNLWQKLLQVSSSCILLSLRIFHICYDHILDPDISENDKTTVMLFVTCCTLNNEISKSLLFTESYELVFSMIFHVFLIPWNSDYLNEDSIQYLAHEALTGLCDDHPELIESFLLPFLLTEESEILLINSLYSISSIDIDNFVDWTIILGYFFNMDGIMQSLAIGTLGKICHRNSHLLFNFLDILVDIMSSKVSNQVTEVLCQTIRFLDDTLLDFLFNFLYEHYLRSDFLVFGSFYDCFTRILIKSNQIGYAQKLLFDERSDFFEIGTSIIEHGKNDIMISSYCTLLSQMSLVLQDSFEPFVEKSLNIMDLLCKYDHQGKYLHTFSLLIFSSPQLYVHEIDFFIESFMLIFRSPPSIQVIESCLISMFFLVNSIDMAKHFPELYSICVSTIDENANNNSHLVQPAYSLLGEIISKKNILIMEEFNTIINSIKSITNMIIDYWNEDEDIASGIIIVLMKITVQIFFKSDESLIEETLNILLLQVDLITICKAYNENILEEALRSLTFLCSHYLSQMRDTILNNNAITQLIRESSCYDTCLGFIGQISSYISQEK